MPIKFSGDFKSLERYMEKLAEAADPSTISIMSQQLAEESISLIRDGFATSTDPYGKPWKPPVLRAGQPLRDKGGLQTSWHPTSVSESGFSVASGKDYATYHQRGTGIYGPHKQRIVPKTAKALKVPGLGYRTSVAGAPKRRMVPERRNPLPAKWRIKYVETAQDVLTELFKGP